MDSPGNQPGEPAAAVEDPPPPTAFSQELSTSESSSQPQQEQQRPPPPPLSPLTGSYLLIVVGEPHSERHKEIILRKIAKAFLSWDVAECHVNLEKELQLITGHSPEGEEARYGERLIQYATENLVTEILIHPQLNTLHQCLKNLLSSFTKHRHIIHAGYTFAGNGSWILQDGTLSISDLIEALHEPEVLRVLKAYENSVSIDVHCAPEGEWTTERFQKEPVTKLCTVRINPGEVLAANSPAISAFIDYLSPFLEPANIQHLLQPTDVVGNIRFTHPTLYVFPGGQGDAALFGINGFNMLIDGGFARKACFWDFARHLDRLDAVLLTRLNNSTVNGISAVLQRKKINHVYPQIGHFFCNLQDRKIALSPDGDKGKDSLIVNLAEEGQEIVANLRHLALKPHPCYRDGNQVDPVNLYHKVGHGKLDMYVISPARDSQAVKEFLAKWAANDSHLFSSTGKKIPGKTFEFPLQNLVSICALLVWQPANPEDTITRILFPGSTPQHKIFEGLEKLRHLEFLKHPVCSAKSMSPAVSTVAVARSLSRTRQSKPVDNRQKETKLTSRPQAKPAKPKTEKTPPKEVKSKLDNKLADEKNELENVEEPLKKLNNRILSKDEQIENIKKEIQKIEQAENEEQKKKIVHRSKYDMRNVKSKVDSRAPSKSVDRKRMLEKKSECEASPPGTPKRALPNGTATRAEKAKAAAKPTKATSPTSTPAKSAKEANNRKVVESRVTARPSSKSVPKKKEETPPPPPLAQGKPDRKPVSRRPKALLSPVKPSLGKAKPEPDSVSKNPGKKTDVGSSVVEAVGQTISKELEKGAEIEKTEIEEGVAGKVEIKTLEADTTENKETETMAVKKESESAQFEVTSREEEEEEEEEGEDEEYLIITKEEYGEESVKEEENEKENDEEAQTKDETEGEGEMKKLLREEEESEKKREATGEKKEERYNDPEVNQRDDEGRRRAGNLEEKTPEGRESELERLMEVDEGIDLKEPASKEHREGESLPEEKISNTVETSATTAPTLPEDERIEEVVGTDYVEGGKEPEEVKEVIEEKYIQEKTKEEKPEEEKLEPEQPRLDVEGPALPVQTCQKKHPRDVVKTPDEVAELPMHEEVDPRMYSSGDYSKELQRKSGEERQEKFEEKPDFKAMIKGEANILDEEDGQESLEERIEDPIVAKYLNIIDELERSATEHKSDEKPAGEEVAVEPERQADAKTDDEKRPSSPQAVEVYLGKTSPEEKDISGGKSPVDLAKDHSGNVSPVEAIKEVMGRSTPKDLSTAPKKDFYGALTPKEMESEVSKEQRRSNSKKSGPQDLQKEVLGRCSSPKAEKPQEKIFIGPSSQDLEKESSEKISPEDVTTDESGKSTPQFPDKDVGSYPQNVEAESFRKSSAKDLEKEIPEKLSTLELKTVSRKSTPEIVENEIVKPINGNALVRDLFPSLTSDFAEKEFSGKSTPQDVVKEMSGKSTPQDLVKEMSGKSTPQDVVKEMSGKSTPQDVVKEMSGKSTPQDLVKEISGKSTPQDVVKEMSGKSTPQDLVKEMSGKSTPQDLVKEMSGKSTPQDLVKEISGKSTPQDLVKEMSGKSTPQDLVKEISGKSTPQDLVKEISGKSTPQDVVKEISGKSTPQDVVNEISGKSTPQDVVKEMSGKSTPQDLVKEMSGKSTPQDLVKEISGKSTPQDVVKEMSGKSTPQDLVKEMSGKSTPQEPENLTLVKDSPVSLGKDISRRSPLNENEELEHEISDKTTPEGISGEITPGNEIIDVQQSSRRSSLRFPHSVEEDVEQYSSRKSSLIESPGKGSPIKEVKAVSGKSSRRESIIERNRTSPAPSSPRGGDLLVPTIAAEELEEQKLKKEDVSEIQILPLGSEALPAKDANEAVEDKRKAVESSESVSSGQEERDQLGKSTCSLIGREVSERISSLMGGKGTSDSFSLALAQKATSQRISSPSPVDISPLSLDDIKEEKGSVPVQRTFERVKCEEGRSSGTSTPERSSYEKSEASALNGMDSDEEPEKGILESEKQEKESQIVDISSGEEEELKGLGDDEDSETDLRRDDVEGRIAKGEKDDINQLVKIGGAVETEEEQDSYKKTTVKRMLVTASSEDGGTETEICIKRGIAIEKGEASEEQKKDDETEEGEFSNSLWQARKEDDSQRCRKTSFSSSEDVQGAEAEQKGAGGESEEEEELSNLMQQAREELAFVRTKHSQMTESPERKCDTKTTTTISETTRVDDDHNIITMKTLLTEERQEQEDGSVRVTTTKETTISGSRNEGTVTTVNTTIERKDDEDSSSQVNSGERWGEKEVVEGRISQEEVTETSRRTSASSIISQEDLVSRKDSAKIEDFRQSSTEMSPLKTTYITSCGDSESLMTSSFYGNLPTEDEMIGRGEHLRELRKGRGYESVTEVGPDGERTERTYFYGGEEEPRVARRERSRFVKTCYTEEEREDGDRSRFVHRFYTSEIPEEETVERTRIVQRFYQEETSLPESEGKFRFVSEAEGLAKDLARAVDEHVSVQGEHLGEESRKSRGEEEEEGEGEEEKEEEEGAVFKKEERARDVIESWGKPLGLPLPPKNTCRNCPFPGQNISTTSTLSTPTDNSDSVSNWGHPMNLPFPAPPPTVNESLDPPSGRTPKETHKETPKKEKKVPPKTSGTNTPNRRSESPVKQLERRTTSTGRTTKSPFSSHVYMDLTYVPHHGNSYYSNVEFFKKVRARYYVFSGTEPSKEVYNALLEAKQTWEDKKLEVTIIPTYDTDVLGYWVTENEEVLAQNKIDLSPSASRCTINLQDHETSCSAYRLEF